MPEMNGAYGEVDGKPPVVVARRTSTSASRSTSPSPTAPAPLLVPEHQARRDHGLRRVLGGLRGCRARGARRQARPPTTSPGTTISLTNPGSIGTVHSVPRLMKGQGAIIGVGALEYPAEFQGASDDDPRTSSPSARSSRSPRTYDHRVIQGAAVGRVPADRARAAARRATASTTSIFARAAHPVRADPLGPATSPSTSTTDDRQDRPRAGAHPRLPRPRPPDGRHRPARVPAAHAPRPRHHHARPDPLGPRPRVRHRRLRRQAA